jgi:uncharacterized protein (DUF2164 family)
MIKKLSTTSEKFDEEDIKKISKTIKNISIDLLEIDKIAGNTYVDLIAQRVEEFYKNQGINPPNWAIGKIPKGNQLQFKNQTSLCLEADDPNSKYYDSRILIRNCDSSNPYQKWTYSIANNFLKNDGSGYCVSSRVSQSKKKYGNKYNPVYVDKCTNNFQDQNIILDENGVLITAVGKGEDTWQYFIKSNELNNNKQKIIQLDNDSKWDYKAKYNVV